MVHMSRREGRGVQEFHSKGVESLLPNSYPNSQVNIGGYSEPLVD
jgi:hypothetical protein